MLDLEFLGELACRAGEAILDVYGTEFDVEHKQDHSPITLADRRSHDIIVQALQSRYADIPVLSEEGREIPYSTRKHWSRFWLVDPLDGTKEFVKRNGEFTVNIALIEGNAPRVGIIYLPVTQKLYMADRRHGCWEVNGSSRRELHVSARATDAPVRMVKSRSHPSPHLEDLLKLLPSYEVVTRGSALKFCSVAAGEADFYPRFGPTWEWDTAAGQAIVMAAGGVMVDLRGEAFIYNKANLLNGPFLVAASREWLTDTGILEKASTLDLA